MDIDEVLASMRVRRPPLKARRNLGFWDGVGVGLVVLSLMFFVWFAFAASGPGWLVRPQGRHWLTELTTSCAWRIGTPIVVFVGFLIVRLRRPAQRLSILAVGVAAVALVAVSYLGMWLALHDRWNLASGISG